MRAAKVAHQENFIFHQIAQEDVQNVANRKLGRNFTDEELLRVRKGMEYGLVMWEALIKYAVDEIEMPKVRLRKV